MHSRFHRHCVHDGRTRCRLPSPWFPPFRPFDGSKIVVSLGLSRYVFAVVFWVNDSNGLGEHQSVSNSEFPLVVFTRFLITRTTVRPPEQAWRLRELVDYWKDLGGKQHENLGRGATSRQRRRSAQGRIRILHGPYCVGCGWLVWSGTSDPV